MKAEKVAHIFSADMLKGELKDHALVSTDMVKGGFDKFSLLLADMVKMGCRKDIIILSACLVLYVINQIYLKRMGILFFNNYFNDLLAVPLYFSLMNIIAMNISKKEIKSFKALFIITVILAFLGEYLAIFLRPGSVTDYLDIVCYFIGMIVYYLIKYDWKNK